MLCRTSCCTDAEVIAPLPAVKPNAKPAMSVGPADLGGDALYEAILQLQALLEPVAAAAARAEGRECTGGLLELQADNTRLRAEVQELNACLAHSHGRSELSSDVPTLDIHLDNVRPMAQSSTACPATRIPWHQPTQSSSSADFGPKPVRQAAPPLGDEPLEERVHPDDGLPATLLDALPVMTEDTAVRFSAATVMRSPSNSQPPMGFKQSIATTASVQSCRSDRSYEPICVGPPKRGFIVNVRRLISAQELMGLLHELIKNTAIAALTLVAAGSLEQLRSTTWFVCCTLVTFRMHDMHWDFFDIEDFKMLQPLLSDDDESGIYNPNRLLKAMSVTQSPYTKWVYHVAHALGVFLVVFGWLICCRWWAEVADGSSEDGPQPDDDYIDHWRQHFIKTEEDGMVLGMQIMVGSLMFILYLTFEALLFNETGAVMPPSRDGSETWDPRVHGLPKRYWFFGLPSMWFTSKETLDDLKGWIREVNATGVAEIYPQEIAHYALSGDEERRDVQRALKDAKLYNGKIRELVLEESGGELKALNIELCFFDDALQSKDCKYPGEFLCIVNADEDTQMADDDPDGTATPSSKRTGQLAASQRPRRLSSRLKDLLGAGGKSDQQVRT